MKAQRYSKQRELVLRTVKDHLTHPTALEIYGLTREKDPTISMGTVYRNLNLLAEQGKILRIKVPGAADRYDGITEPHNHAVCTSCGMVMDYCFDFEDLSRSLEKSGFKCEELNITVRGTCKNCLTKADE
ncbi:MAG: transcriptional repressor [Spirochaetia bacterium]|nr:transcriptional repressor [Spirochaetia bacterium]